MVQKAWKVFMFWQPQGIVDPFSVEHIPDMHPADSRPDLIDSALLRPGRLDKSLFCGMPDLEEREDVCHVFTLVIFSS
jgi:ATP-dependent 26S proteasome regulatory subunit